MDDRWIRWQTVIDAGKGQWAMKPLESSDLAPATLHCEELSPGELKLSGMWQASTIEVRLKRIPDANLKLLSRPPRLFQD